MPPPLRQLEAFHAVVVNGSMTKAAAYLNISQPAISRLVASLEDNIGFPLFKRLAGRYRATPEARVLFDEVAKALANLDHISRLTQDFKNNKAGQLRVTCLPGFATSLLPRVLARFLSNKPGLRLTLEPRDSKTIQEWMSAQLFDVGISELFDEIPAIDSEPILIRTVCIAPAGHPLADKKVVTPKDLDGLPLINISRDLGFFAALQRAFDSYGVELKGSVETRQFAPACIMVAEGYGVSVVSEIDAREYEDEGLVIRPFKPSVPFQINILYPAYMTRSIMTLEFVEAFKQSLEPFRL
jgi:DNA-binding transcriptional LysR family regulator